MITLTLIRGDDTLYEPRYQEWGFKLIPSCYGELKGQKRYYRVIYGTVHWQLLITILYIKLVLFLFNMVIILILILQEKKAKSEKIFTATS
jgi:hypothetical protein